MVKSHCIFSKRCQNLFNNFQVYFVKSRFVSGLCFYFVGVAKFPLIVDLLLASVSCLNFKCGGKILRMNPRLMAVYDPFCHFAVYPKSRSDAKPNIRV